MDAVWLPALTSVHSLKDAVAVMHDSKRSGVLVESAGSCKLVYIGSVLEAIDRGATMMAELREGDAVHTARADDATRYGVDLIHPLHTRFEYEMLLDTERAPYSVVAQAYNHALIVTRHERFERMLNAGSTYYCDGPQRHYFPSPDVQVGEDCPKCSVRPKGKIFLM